MAAPKILHKVKIKKRHSESKEMLAYSRNDPLSCHKISLGLLKAVFVDGVKKIQTSFNNITIPTLMLGRSLEPLNNSQNFASFLEKFNSKDKTIKIYKNVKHRIVQNDAKDEAIPYIIEWLKARN